MLGISLPESLDASLGIGDEGDRAGNERIRDVSILLSERNKEKVLAIGRALKGSSREHTEGARNAGMRTGQGG